MPGPPASTISPNVWRYRPCFGSLNGKRQSFIGERYRKLQTHRRYRPRCRGSTRPAARRSTAARRRCRAGCGSRSTPRSSSAARTVRPRPGALKIAPFVCPILVLLLYGAFVWARGVFDGLCGGSRSGQGRGCSWRAARSRLTWSLATRKVKLGPTSGLQYGFPVKLLVQVANSAGWPSRRSAFLKCRMPANAF